MGERRWPPIGWAAVVCCSVLFAAHAPWRWAGAAGYAAGAGARSVSAAPPAHGVGDGGVAAGGGAKVVRLLGAGEIASGVETLTPHRDPDQVLVIYRAADEQSRSALEALCAR